MRCWGNNDFGELGTGDYTQQAAPGSAPVSSAIDVGLGTGGGCALLADGGVDCWGQSPAGDGTESLAPLRRSSTIAMATKLSVGFWHACALVDGQAQCWGANVKGELGRGTRSLSAVPVDVALPSTMTNISVGPFHACAVNAASVYCWGTNEYSQLGDGTNNSILAPVPVATGVTNITGVAAAYARSCVWNGTTAKCWGRNVSGVNGTGTPSRANTTPVTVGITPVTSMALGDRHTCAVTTDDSLTCWGSNDFGQLGFSGGDTATPTIVATGTVARVVAGTGHTCVRKLDSTVSCWGHNTAGQVGNGQTANTSTPVSVLSNVQDISAGDQFTCAVANGVLYCWGANEVGQLGLGDKTPRRVPTAVALPDSAVAADVEAGGRTTCVRATNAKTYCWGDGAVGQLASGITDVEQLTPLETTVLQGIDRLAIGSRGGCRIGIAGVRCWGSNGTLGNGDVAHATPGPTLLACP